MKRLRLILAISLVCNGILIGIFVKDFFNGKKILSYDNKGESANLHSFFPLYPDFTAFPIMPENFNELETRFLTENNLESLEKNIKDKLKNQKSDEYYYLLGKIYEQKNMLKKALKYYQKASRFFPLRTYFIACANIYRKLGENDMALLEQDKAMITLGNKWYFYLRNMVTNNIVKNDNKNLKDKIIDVKLKISAINKSEYAYIKIVNLLKNAKLEEAYKIYNKAMNNLVRDAKTVTYKFDRLIKVFVPYYYLDMTQFLDQSVLISTYYGYNAQQLRRYPSKFSEKEAKKIEYYHEKLLEFYYKVLKGGMEIVRYGYKNICTNYDDFLAINDLIKYQIKTENYEYLREKFQTMLAQMAWNNIIEHNKDWERKRVHNYEELKPYIKKWLKKAVKSF